MRGAARELGTSASLAAWGRARARRPGVIGMRSGAGRVESMQITSDVNAAVTGGGTVFVPSGFTGMVLASFGVNARRPASFVGGGTAEGRINYDRHDKSAGNHVNVPVVAMEALFSS